VETEETVIQILVYCVMKPCRLEIGCQ